MASAFRAENRANGANEPADADVIARTAGIPEPIAHALAMQLASRYPGMYVVEIRPLAPDSGASASSTEKVAGYGRPLVLHLCDADGNSVHLVWRINAANEFGHDRLADRAANTLLAREDFARIPQHVAALEVGAVTRDGHIVPLPGDAELYLITPFVPGTLYADDLRRIARAGEASEVDLARVDTLASYLARLHVPDTRPHAYRRAIRDLVGHGEGIFGIVDGYPADVEGAPELRLHAIERRCVDWRWRLRAHEGRLARVHGDFHPFNILFDHRGELNLLDASRGTRGDPVDDLTALAVNYVLFALDTPDPHASWQRAFGRLWSRLWRGYLAARPDPDLLAVAPPFFAWRALVVCNPRFYPHLSPHGRDALLSLAEHVLDAGHLDLAAPEALFP
jgi:hypothetical protein